MVSAQRIAARQLFAQNAQVAGLDCSANAAEFFRHRVLKKSASAKLAHQGDSAFLQIAVVPAK